MSPHYYYRCTFEDGRIGRAHDIAPLDVRVQLDDPRPQDTIAERVFEYARPHLVSEAVNVVVDFHAPPATQGLVLCGFRVGAAFTIDRLGGEPA